MISNREVNKSEDEYVNMVFMGVVEDIQDPRKEGRCKVRVISMHEDAIATEDLPWAYPAQKSTIFGANGAGSISIPKKGAMVIVKFNNGNIYSPEYYSIHELAQDVKDELNSEYEGSHILLFDSDEKLKIWFTPNKGMTISIKDTFINIDLNNNIRLKSTNKVIVESPRIELGTDAVESVIKGDAFLKAFNSHTHPGPNLTPTLPLTEIVLSKKVKVK